MGETTTVSLLFMMLSAGMITGFKYSSTYLTEQLLEILRYNKVDTVFKLK